MKPTCHIRVGLWAYAAIQLGACSEQPTEFDVEYKELASQSLDATESNQFSSESQITADSSLQTKVIRRGIDPMPDEIGEVPMSELLRGRSRASVRLAELKSAEVSLDLDQMLAEQRIVMTGSTSDEVAMLTQINRPSYFDSFQQGFTGIKEEEFVQTEEPGGVLDVMVVVDNSGSMYEEQENLSTKLDPLLSYVSGSDWRIAVNTTDPSDGCVTHLIQKGESEPQRKFAEAVSAGVQGSGNERGILQARKGLEGSCLTSPWIRANSTVAVLIVADEDNCSSNGVHCPNQPYNTPNYLYDYLNSIRSAGNSARVYGIISHPSQPCASAANIATQYADVIQRTSGTWGDICEADYSATLRAISQNIASTLKAQWALAHTPDNGSLEVLVNGVRQSTGYSLTGNVVEFATAPAAGSRIQFRYRHTSSVHQSFTLNHAAASDSIVAEINGVPTTAFSYSEQNRRLRFDVTPPDSATIMVRYRGDVQLNHRFALGAKVVSRSLRVAINGNRQQSGFSYDPETGELIFLTPPSDGAQIEVEFDRLATPQLSYPFFAGENSVQVVDSVSRRPLVHAVRGSEITFDASEYEYGRHVSIVSSLDSIGQGSYALGIEPIPTSVVIASDDARCDLNSGLVVSGNLVQVDGCDLGRSGSVVHISYQYWLRNPGPYAVDPSLIDAEAAIQVWSVWIDGIASTNFEIKDNQVFIKDDEVPSTAEMVVEVEFLRTP